MNIVAIIVLAVFATFYAYILTVSSQSIKPINPDKHRFLWRMRQLYCPATFLEVTARFVMELLICGILLDVGHIFIDDTATILLAIPVERLLVISIAHSVIASKAKKYYIHTEVE